MPLNLFSKYSDNREEPYVRPSIFQLERAESMASDATAPNNPGPGRNLGRLYDTLGARLEDFLNSRAGRLELGPDAVAQKIRSLRRYREAFDLGLICDNQTLPTDREIREIRSHRGYEELYGSPTPEDIRILKKLCCKLLKYCRSQELATQLRALNQVTALAIEDLHVRQLLAGVLHDSFLVPKYRERELHILSAKARISIEDNEVHEFWTQFIEGYVNSGRYYKSLRNDPDTLWFNSQLAIYFSDPNVSFLVARLLRKELEKTFYVGAFKPIWQFYINVAIANPQIIEADCLYVLFDGGEGFYDTQCVICDNVDHIMELARHFPIFSGSMTLGALQWHRWTTAKSNLENLENRSHQIMEFLNKLCGSEDLAAQLWYLRSLDVNTRGLLQETILGNEILIAYTHISHICPATNKSKLRGAETYFSGATVILNYYFTGNTDEHDLAKIILSRSMEQTRYFKYALSTLLPQYGRTLLLQNPPSLPREMPPSLLKNQYRIRRSLFRNNNDHLLVGGRADMHENDVLHCSLGDTIWLRVYGDERPFDSTGRFPVLAGCDISGREIYVARISYSESGLRWPHWSETFVSDGARSVSFVGDDGKRRTTSRFDVMVLRHDPCDVMYNRMEIPEGAKFQTGPVYWVREEEDDSYSEVDGESCSDSDSNVDDRFVELVPEDTSTCSISLEEDSEAPSQYDGWASVTDYTTVEDLDLEAQEITAPLTTDKELRTVLEHTVVELERRDVELEKRDAELQRSRRLLEEQQQRLEAQQRELEKQRRELEQQKQELEELRALKSSSSGILDDVCVGEE